MYIRNIKLCISFCLFMVLFAADLIHVTAFYIQYIETYLQW